MRGRGSARIQDRQEYPVTGDGGFDYIVFDSSSNRLYVSHGTEVDVRDADSGKLLGKVEDTPGVLGIAIVPGLHRMRSKPGSFNVLVIAQ